MAVLIGHASIDERGKISGGQAGDQTGKEVCTRNWYKKPWTFVLRPQAMYAEKIARAMEQACANNNIGYDQTQRTTLYTQAKAVGWDLSKIKTKCECDCSSLVAVCCIAAGLNVSKDIYTGNEKAALIGTGAFTAYSTADYIGSETKLKRGDVLLSSGHTAIVLSNGSGVSTATPAPSTGSVKATGVAKKKDSKYSGTYKVTASALNIRHDAGTNHVIMVSIPKGTSVNCYGYYSQAKDGSIWLYIQFAYKGTTYTGFAHSGYLAK